MNRKLSNLGPALFLALLILAATALAVAAPEGSWTLGAGPLLLVLGLLGADFVARRRAGARAKFSPSALRMAAAIVAACGLMASDPGALVAMVPILGGCATLPWILRREGARVSCR